MSSKQIKLAVTVDPHLQFLIKLYKTIATQYKLTHNYNHVNCKLVDISIYDL